MNMADIVHFDEGTCYTMVLYWGSNCAVAMTLCDQINKAKDENRTIPMTGLPYSFRVLDVNVETEDKEKMFGIKPEYKVIFKGELVLQ